MIKLEQNYRSTQNILDAANAVIANNQGRKEKRLWTDNGAGDKITFEQLDTAAEEADFVARDIARRVRKESISIKTVPFSIVPMHSPVSLRNALLQQIFHIKFLAA